jgi:hypothetical protein
VRFCEKHVARVRGMCCELGLESRISRDEAHLRERLANRDTFDIDPLYHALLALRILAVAVAERNNVHAKLMGCPLCVWAVEATQHDWMNKAATSVRDLVNRRDAEKRADQERTVQAEEAYRSL